MDGGEQLAWIVVVVTLPRRQFRCKMKNFEIEDYSLEIRLLLLVYYYNKLIWRRELG
jgi:hypothetical protein